MCWGWNSKLPQQNDKKINVQRRIMKKLLINLNCSRVLHFSCHELKSFLCTIFYSFTVSLSLISWCLFIHFHNNDNNSSSEMMPWLTAIILTCVLRTTSSETIAENDFRFISYHGELIFNSFSLVIYTTVAIAISLSLSFYCSQHLSLSTLARSQKWSLSTQRWSLIPFN